LPNKKAAKGHESDVLPPVRSDADERARSTPTANASNGYVLEVY
jgi:hypothetical protein